MLGPGAQHGDPLIKVLQRNLRALLRGGDLKEAARVLERLEDAAPLTLETRALELELLLQSRRDTEADALARQLTGQFPASSRVQYLAGIAAYRLRNYESALERFGESQRLHPHWKHQRWLGKSQTQLGRLDQAEALLLPLSKDHPACLVDLAWNCERRGDIAGALDLLERHHGLYPDDRFTLARMRRLKAQELSADEVQEEISLMQELGETPDPELIPIYLKALLETGQGAGARDYVREHRAGWSLDEIRQCAWVCHKSQAFDLAFELFLELLRHDRHNYKYLQALEKAARNAGRLDTLCRLYEELAPQDKRFYGRARKLRPQLGDSGASGER